MAMTPYQGSSAIALGILGWGDQVVGQALTLLLNSSGYETRFLPGSSLSASGALKDVQLLLLTPRPKRLSTERREALLASLKDTPRGREVPVLELVTPSEGSETGAAQDESWHVVPWPCRLKELEKSIRAALAENTRQLQLSASP